MVDYSEVIERLPTKYDRGDINYLYNIKYYPYLELSSLMIACLVDSPEAVQKLLKIPGISIDTRNSRGDHALIVACQQGHAGIVELLLNATTDKQKLIMLQNYRGWHALMCACEKGHVEIVRLILNASTDKQKLVMLKSYVHGLHALMCACEEGHIEIVQLLLNASTDKQELLKFQSSSGQHALMSACRNGHVEIVQLILNASTNKLKLVMRKDEDGKCALLDSHVNVTQFILKAIADKQELIMLRYKDRWHKALMSACEKGHVEIVQLLLNASTDKQELFMLKDESGYNALMHASEKGHVEIVQMILKASTDKQKLLMLQNVERKHALMCACEEGHFEVVRLILNASTDKQKLVMIQSDFGWHALMRACENGDVSIVQLILNVSPDKQKVIMLQNDDRWHALMIACKIGHFDMVQLILNSSTNKGDLLALQNENGDYAVEVACKGKHSEIVKLLFSESPDQQRFTTLLGKSGDDVFLFACHHSLFQVMRMILNACTNQKERQKLLALRNDDGRHPFMIASARGHTDIARLCLNASTNKQHLLVLQDKKGIHPLMLTSEGGHIEVVRLILNASSDKQHLICLQDHTGKHALQCAYENQHPDIVQLILDECKDKQRLLSLQSENRLTTLWSACDHCKDSRSAQLIFSAATEDMLFQQNEKGENLLMHSPALLALILGASTDKQRFISQQDKDGKSVLMHAWNDVVALKVVLNASANTQYLIAHQDNYGKTILMYAWKDAKALELVLNACTDKQRLISQQNKDGQNVLMYAWQDPKALDLVLNACTDKQHLITQQDKDGKNILMYAWKDVKALDLILNACTDKQHLIIQQDKDGKNIFMYAWKDATALEFVLNASTDRQQLISQQDKDGRNVLMHIFMDSEKFLVTVEMLLNASTDKQYLLTQQDKYGTNAFCLLYEHTENDDYMKLLLEYKDDKKVFQLLFDAATNKQSQIAQFNQKNGSMKSSVTNAIKYSNFINEQFLSQQDENGKTAFMYACCNDEIILQKLKNGNCSEHLVTKKDSYGKTAFLYACEAGNYDIAVALLNISGENQQVCKQDQDGMNILMHGCQQASARDIDIFLSKFSADRQNLMTQQDKDGRTALMYACLRIQTYICRILLDAISDKQRILSLQDKDGKNALMYACESKWCDRVIYLILNASTDKQYLVTQQDKDGRNSLMYACNSGSMKVIQAVLNASTDTHYLVTQQDKTGKNALMHASTNKKIQLILDASTEKQHLISQTDKDGKNCLMHHPFATKLLLNASTDKKYLIAQQDKDGKNVLMHFFENVIRALSTNKQYFFVLEQSKMKYLEVDFGVIFDFRIEVQSLILQQDKNKKNSLMYSIDSRNFEGVGFILETCLKKQQLLSQLDQDGNNALMVACEKGDSEAVQLILDYSPEKQQLLSQQNSSGLTSLMYSCKKKDTKSAFYILSASTEKHSLVTLKDKNDKTALMFACESKMTELVDLILNVSADKQYLVTQQSKDGRNSLMYASESGNMGAVQAILDASTNKQALIAQLNGNNENALVHMLLHWPWTDTVSMAVQLIIEARTDKQSLIALQDNFGGHLFLFDYFKRMNKDTQFQLDQHGNNVLILACENRDARAVELVLNFSDDRQKLLSQQNKNGQTALMCSCKKRDLKSAELLLNACSDKQSLITLQDKNGTTAFMFACSSKMTEIIKLVWSASSDKQYLVAQQSKDGRNSLMYASGSGNAEAVQAILDASTNMQDLINQQSKDGRNSLMYASESGSVEAIQAILDASTNKRDLISQLNGKNENALFHMLHHWPWSDTMREPVQLILEASTDKQKLISRQDKSGMHALILACQRKCSEVVEVLLKASTSPQILIGQQDKNGTHALMVACQRRCFEAVQLLLKASEDPKSIIGLQDKSGRDALMTAISSGDDKIAKMMLVTYKAIINFQNAKEQRLLYQACQSSNSKLVSVLLDTFVDSSLKKEICESAALMAIERGLLEIVKVLVEKGVNVYELDNSPLGKAVKCGSKEMITYILKMRASIDSQDTNGMTPLMWADKVETVNFLLENGANPNMQDHQGRSVLHHRLSNDKTSDYVVIELLLRRGANPNLLDKQLKSATDMLIDKYQAKRLNVIGRDPQSMTEKMMAIEGHVKKYPRTLCDDPLLAHKPIILARGKYNFGFILGLSSSGLYVKKIVDSTQCSILSEGDYLWKVNDVDVRKHSTEQLSALLENEDRAIFFFYGCAPTLREAITQQDIKTISHALGSGHININSHAFESSKNRSNKLSALMLACEEGHVEVAKLLIDHWHADVDQVNEDGWSALTIACLHQHYEITEMLLKKANVNLQNSEGWSALMFACRAGHLKLARLLLQKGANVNLQNAKQWTALMIACERKHSEIVRLLLEKKAQVNIRKDDKGFALKIASENGSVRVVKQLLDQHAKVNMQNNKGWTALMSASKEGHSEVMMLLLERKADIDVQDDKGWSALMNACEEGHEKVVELLLEYEASTDLQSHKGDSALSLALNNKYTYIANVLTKHQKTDVVQQTDKPGSDLDSSPFPDDIERPKYSRRKQQLLYNYKKPVRPPKQGEKEFDTLRKFCQEVEIIIQVENENEYQAAVTVMKSPCHNHFSSAVKFPRSNTVVGMFGENKTCLLYSNQGIDSSDYVQDAIENFPRAKFVVGVGIGYAFDSSRHNLGDVLVSKQICQLLNPKFDENSEIVDCGEHVNIVNDLMATFCMNLDHETSFFVSNKNRCTKANAGRIVSFPTSINDKKMREKIKYSLLEAIGGGTEGGQLHKFMLKQQIEGVAVIRGVSHYADGSMGDEWEYTASLAALHYVSSKLCSRKDSTELITSIETAVEGLDSTDNAEATDSDAMTDSSDEEVGNEDLNIMKDSPVYRLTNYAKATAGKSVSVKFSINPPPNQHFLKKAGCTAIQTQYEILDDEIFFTEVCVEDSGTYTISCRGQDGVELTANFVLDVSLAIDFSDDPTLEHEEMEIKKGFKNFGFKFGETNNGLMVTEILDKSQCPELSKGDIIWKVNGKIVLEFSASELTTFLNEEKSVSFEIVRPSQDTVALEKAIRQGITEDVTLYLQTSNIDINSCCFESYSGNLSALMLASENGRLDIVKLLAENRNAKINLLNQEGWSALMYASLKGHDEVAKFLLEKGAEVDLQNSDGWSALMLASKGGHFEVAQLLLDKGATVDLQDKRSWSALMVACEKNFPHLVRLLLKKSAKVNLCNNNRGTALKIASQHGCLEIVKKLLKRGAEISMQDKNGWSALMSACKGNHFEVVKKLIKKQANINLENKEGYTALMIACEEGHCDIAKLLMNYGADIGHQSQKGDSALTLTMTYKHQLIMDEIVKHITKNKNEVTEIQADVIVDDESPFPSEAIHLTLKTLNLIKWKDDRGRTHHFHLVTGAKKIWKNIGFLLNYSMKELEDIKREHDGSDELCWCDIMEAWVIKGGTGFYPVSWDGLHKLLVDAGAFDAAKQLRVAVTHAVIPSFLEQRISDDQPAYDDDIQKLLYREHRPSKPPKKGSKEFKTLKDFCSRVQILMQVVTDNEYKAAVVYMKPPENTLFKTAVTFPKPGFVIGMFAEKETALIHTDEGSSCSDYLEDAFTTFSKAKFLISTGAGYAFDRSKYKLGDVLVSKQICNFENFRFNRENKLVDRGQRIDVTQQLVSIFCKNLLHEEKYPVSDSGRFSHVDAGQFASLPFIVESKEIRDKVHFAVREAIGGDMEGRELLKFRLKRKIEGVIVIKGVVHYADGNKADEWEFTASLAALNYIRSKLCFYQDSAAICSTTNLSVSLGPAVTTKSKQEAVPIRHYSRFPPTFTPHRFTSSPHSLAIPAAVNSRRREVVEDTESVLRKTFEALKKPVSTNSPVLIMEDCLATLDRIVPSQPNNLQTINEALPHLPIFAERIKKAIDQSIAISQLTSAKEIQEAITENCKEVAGCSLKFCTAMKQINIKQETLTAATDDLKSVIRSLKDSLNELMSIWGSELQNSNWSKRYISTTKQLNDESAKPAAAPESSPQSKKPPIKPKPSRIRSPSQRGPPTKPKPSRTRLLSESEPPTSP